MSHSFYPRLKTFSSGTNYALALTFYIYLDFLYARCAALILGVKGAARSGPATPAWAPQSDGGSCGAARRRISSWDIAVVLLLSCREREESSAHSSRKTGHRETGPSPLLHPAGADEPVSGAGRRRSTKEEFVLQGDTVSKARKWLHSMGALCCPGKDSFLMITY